jgi:hypothetical protein
MHNSYAPGLAAAEIKSSEPGILPGRQSARINLARISLLLFQAEKAIDSKYIPRRIMSMKTKTGYLVVWVTLVLLFVGPAYIFASQEASSFSCDGGVVNIGDMDVDVQAKCGEPNSQNMNVWVYNFGPSQPIYSVIFNDGEVVQILEDEQGH